ncbi:hypothetical protein [Ralstonia flaminis]|jgi:hypothetical protein|uniref:Cytochrome c family protein n=1 Tax=Ralstonia flaminis TaxID=3058597 RepID=A0ABM9K6I9_9RALS|nr:hypothetical protein [Ralstonia sp. LMG 18101]CAJ0816635.1 hypothetical protein LMG18101_03001 [Ralstonia sp. LMG 18101]
MSLRFGVQQALRGAALLAALSLAQTAAAQAVPTDAAGGCPISPATVASFFESGTVTLNGVVKPADSTVALAPNCGFFQWTEQMFLWLTSPAPATYGGGSHVMFSPQFYTVSPEDSSGRRNFIPNSPGRPINMFLRAMELGPHGLPIVMARTGQIVEVPHETPGQKPPSIRLANGKLIPGTQVQNVRKTEQGTLELLDARGKLLVPKVLKLAPIVRQRALLSADRPVPIVPMKAFTSAIQARKLVIKGIPIFIDPAGNVIDVEPGQADSGVLISQNGSLIYYIIAVNDVFAFHRTMQGAAVIPGNTNIAFPTSMADVNAVVSFAASKGHTIQDPKALAIETKSSWMDASKVPNPNDYIQVEAVVPTFDKSNPNNWVPNGQTTLKLVMLGLHVVGSTSGHGEMVWGTFEHEGNAPNATYAYNSTSGLKTVAQNTSGSWLFTPSGSSGPFNATNNSWTGTAITGTPVGPSPVLRAKPWGSNDGGNPANAAGLNTQVISANASVISQLNAADVRRQYFQLGTTWTIGGAPPNGGNEVGTNHLANATMETFVQGATPSAPSANCFSCHTTNKVPVSHVYPRLTPLP